MIYPTMLDGSPAAGSADPFLVRASALACSVRVHSTPLERPTNLRSTYAASSPLRPFRHHRALVLGVALVLYAQLRWDRTFTAPASALQASTDSAAIARGRYLVYGPAHCAYCHTSGPEQWARIDAGEPVPLTGGLLFPIPPGRFRTPNLTPDPETGIGRRSDEELVQLIRHGVRADGRAAVPFMEFFGLSDEDLVGIISYLRSQAPVRNAVPEHELSFLGKVVMALVIAPPEERPTPPASSPPAGPTVERGAYLANNVALCAG